MQRLKQRYLNWFCSGDASVTESKSRLQHVQCLLGLTWLWRRLLRLRLLPILCLRLRTRYGVNGSSWVFLQMLLQKLLLLSHLHHLCLLRSHSPSTGVDDTGKCHTRPGLCSVAVSHHTQ